VFQGYVNEKGCRSPHHKRNFVMGERVQSLGKSDKGLFCAIERKSNRKKRGEPSYTKNGAENSVEDQKNLDFIVVVDKGTLRGRTPMPL